MRASSAGHAVPLTADSGYFWVFRESNLELVAKVLDGRPVNGYYWLFYGALSDVEYTITVTDTVSGERRFYDNPPGEICGRGDNAAFPLGGPVGGALTAGSGAAATAEPRRPAR